MGSFHTLLGSTIGGRAEYTPLEREVKVNSRFTLTGVEIGKSSPFYPAVLDRKEFSLNIFSGKLLDSLTLIKVKSKVCGTKKNECASYNGKLKFSPMLENSPLSLECKVYDVIDLADRVFVMADIAEVWSGGVLLSDEDFCQTEN